MKLSHHKSVMRDRVLHSLGAVFQNPLCFDSELRKQTLHPEGFSSANKATFPDEIRRAMLFSKSLDSLVKSRKKKTKRYFGKNFALKEVRSQGTLRLNMTNPMTFRPLQHGFYMSGPVLCWLKRTDTVHNLRQKRS